MTSIEQEAREWMKVNHFGEAMTQSEYLAWYTRLAAFAKHMLSKAESADPVGQRAMGDGATYSMAEKCMNKGYDDIWGKDNPHRPKPKAGDIYLVSAGIKYAIEQGLATPAASGQGVDQWIPVSSGKLPEDGTYVEVYDPATEPELPFDIARYDDGEWHGQIAPMKLNPTHWKPWKCVPPGAGRVEDIDPVAP